MNFDTAFKIAELISFLCAGVISYGRLMAKIKELEMKIVNLEDKVKVIDKQDDKIMDKLDLVLSKVNSIEVQLQNKQDRH
jgi:hypothetical protein